MSTPTPVPGSPGTYVVTADLHTLMTIFFDGVTAGASLATSKLRPDWDASHAEQHATGWIEQFVQQPDVVAEIKAMLLQRITGRTAEQLATEMEGPDAHP